MPAQVSRVKLDGQSLRAGLDTAKKVEQIVPGSRHTAPYSQEVPLSWRIIIRPLKYICVKPSKILGRVSQTFLRNPFVKGGKAYLPNPQTFFG